MSEINQLAHKNKSLVKKKESLVIEWCFLVYNLLKKLEIFFIFAVPFLHSAMMALTQVPTFLTDMEERTFQMSSFELKITAEYKH